jgi:predicted nucleic acid-binding protein
MLCCDASIVLRVLLLGDERIASHWVRWEAANEELIAPLLLRYEATNAIHRRVTARLIGLPSARQVLSAVIGAPIRLIDDPALHEQAFALAHALGLPAADDAHYLALAQREGIDFWTADRKLFNAVRYRYPWVHLAD